MSILNRKTTGGNEESMNDDAMAVFLEAFVTGDVGRAIENQEARGQRSFVHSDTLPKRMLSGSREQVEAMGVAFGEDADDLFVRCTFPTGWKKEATDHSMWSHLVDEQGRKRATIFYKAAFYDRDAHMTLERRYTTSVQPVGGWEGHSFKAGGTFHGVVIDTATGEHIATTDTVTVPPPYEDRDAWLAAEREKDALSTQCQSWLAEHYPDWLNPLAYWD